MEPTKLIYNDSHRLLNLPELTTAAALFVLEVNVDRVLEVARKLLALFLRQRISCDHYTAHMSAPRPDPTICTAAGEQDIP